MMGRETEKGHRGVEDFSNASDCLKGVSSFASKEIVKKSYGIEATACNDIPCPQDGIWLSWLPWSQCGATCGQSVARHERKCVSPTNDGSPCNGSATEHRMCQYEECHGDKCI
ncbi:hypothetical protein LSH36_81g05002 [Paralvinella palmiformis]|uniref:Uncharacterized protein n=1 Tax=Paralvinella palmiformis TaxID=53620 RepID=A0AAD9K1V6_9ANNE|nr:hypothetical protein LSH36_81g05002 [Paralvinella palmiformis]